MKNTTKVPSRLRRPRKRRERAEGGRDDCSGAGGLKGSRTNHGARETVWPYF